MFVQMKSHVSRYLSDHSGATAIIYALAMIPILLGLGLAVEFRETSKTRANLQSVLDQTVMNAIIDLSSTGDSSQVEDTFSANMVRTIPFPTTHTITYNSDGTVAGQASTFVPATFSNLIGRQGFEINVASLAGATQEVKTPCIIALDTNRENSLTLNGGANLEASGCSLDIHSEFIPAAVFNGGTNLEADPVCIAGTTVINNSNLIDGVDFETGCTPIDDTIGAEIEEPLFSSCNGVTGPFASDVTLQPGTYCGGLNFNPGVDVDFEGGLYIIRGGDWVVNGGDWEGDDVTFYFEDTSVIQFNSGVSADLKPPENGDYEGILFAESPDLPISNFVLNDSENFKIEGLIYLPSRNLIINSNNDARARDILLVTNSLIMNSANWIIENTVAPDVTASSSTFVLLQ